MTEGKREILNILAKMFDRRSDIIWMWLNTRHPDLKEIPNHLDEKTLLRYLQDCQDKGS